MRRMLAIAVSVAWLACPTFAVAFPMQSAETPSSSIVISPGERIEFTIGPNGALSVDLRGPMSASESANVPNIPNTTEAIIGANLRGHVTKAHLTAMLAVGADGAKLIVLNGYGRPIAYRALLMEDRDGKRLEKLTSVCPVRAGSGGVETWAEPIDGMILTGFKEADPNDLKCSEDSLLTVVAPAAPPERFACEPGYSPGPLASLTVDLIVNSSAAVQEEDATWVVSDRGKDLDAPALLVRFGMLGRAVVQNASGLSVLAMVKLEPRPKAKTADIVLFLNGVEKVRRPWRMYTGAMAAPTNPKNKPVAFYGIIPIGPEGDEGLKEVLATIGQAGASIEVRVVGDDGTILAHGTYPVDTPLTRDNTQVQALLDQALAMAKTPSLCRKLKH